MDRISFPCSVRQTSESVSAYFLSVDDGAANTASLVRLDASTGETEPLHGPAGLETLASCVGNGAVYLLFSQMEGFEKAVFVMAHRNDGTTAGPFPLTNFGKYSNPSGAVHCGKLHVMWESYGATTVVVHTAIDLAEGLTAEQCEFAATNAAPVTEVNANAYRPRLASNGKNLVLAYELFSGSRYRIIGRCLTDSGFSAAHELGSDSRNDQEPWLVADGDRFILAFENSSPLYKNYIWISPSGSKVIIPAFGHGWRVETKQYLKRVQVEAGALRVSEGDGLLSLDDKESSGCPVVLPAGGGRLIVLWLDIDAKKWHVRYRTFSGGGWSEMVDTGLVQKWRVPPAAHFDATTNSLTVFACNAETLAPDLYCEEIVLQGSPAEEESLVHPARHIPSDVFPKRESITYAGEELTVFWGDLHMHTNLSGCSLHPKFHCVELEEKYRQCRDVGRLDFAMVTDHDCMDDHEWTRTKAAARFHNRPGLFTAFEGFEWTATHGDFPKQGHYNVLYRDSGKLYRLKEESGNHITKLWDDMVEGDVLTIPHHPANGVHTLDTNYFDPRFGPLVEIFQVRGSYEYFGNSMDPSKYRPVEMVPGRTILEMLEQGLEFGFTSGGEHEGVGVTAVFAQDNTRDAIFEALRKRHVYGTTGDHIFIDFRLNGALMGEEITDFSGTPEISVCVKGTAPIRELRIMHDGEKVYSQSFSAPEAQITWKDEEFGVRDDARKAHYYYVVAEQENDEIVWASPVFIKT